MHSIHLHLRNRFTFISVSPIANVESCQTCLATDDRDASKTLPSKEEQEKRNLGSVYERPSLLNRPLPPVCMYTQYTAAMGKILIVYTLL